MRQGHRRLLMASLWYPPTPGAGAERAAAFVRHLPEFGWRTTVLTAGEPQREPSESDVIRVPAGPNPATILADYAGPPPKRASLELLRWILFPDRFFRWRMAARRQALRLFHPGDFDAVWAGFPPASSAIVGAYLARAFQVPLVLDIRDPWLGPGGFDPKWAALRRRHERLQRVLVAQSRLVVAVSDAIVADLIQNAGLNPNRALVVPNGFDDADCPTCPGPADSSTRLLVYVGTLSHRNRPDLFLQALAAHRSSSYRVRFIGNLSRAHVERLGLADRVETTGLLSRPLAWRETCSAPALLLLVGSYVARWGLSVKLFNYLRAGRPILCVEETPDSNDARLLRKLAPDRTVFAPLQDPPAILEGINRVLQLAAASPATAVSPDALSFYNRRELTRRLAERLDTL